MICLYLLLVLHPVLNGTNFPPPLQAARAGIPNLTTRAPAPQAPITLGAMRPQAEAPPRTSPFAPKPSPHSTRMPWASLPANTLQTRSGRRQQAGGPAATFAPPPPPDAAARKHELLPVEEDPMARVCCNALLRAYRGAAPIQWPRMIALVLGMSKCASRYGRSVSALRCDGGGVAGGCCTPAAPTAAPTLRRHAGQGRTWRRTLCRTTACSRRWWSWGRWSARLSLWPPSRGRASGPRPPRTASCCAAPPPRACTSARSRRGAALCKRKGASRLLTWTQHFTPSSSWHAPAAPFASPQRQRSAM